MFCWNRELKYDASTRSIGFMRKLVSMLLVAVFGFPLVSPLFAMGTTTTRQVMACCRRDGKHHCAGSMADRTGNSEHEIRVTALPEKCPFCPARVFGIHHDFPGMVEAESASALLVTRPSGVVQTESRLRISRDRSRQKRGPPASMILA